MTRRTLYDMTPRRTCYNMTIRVPGTTHETTVLLCITSRADMGKLGADALRWIARKYGISPLALDYSVRPAGTLS